MTGVGSFGPGRMESFDRLKAALADRYTIERKLGSGGMADVYLTHDIPHNRKVAIKVMHPELAQLVGVERFLREIETTVVLNWFDELRARVPR